MTREETIDKAVSLFDEGYACSQSVLLAFSPGFGLEDDMAKRIASVFGGGMGRLREKCGALTGAFMVLGLAYGNTKPKDMAVKLDAYRKVRMLNQDVENIYGSSSCAALLKKYAKPSDVAARAHHQIICRKIVGDTVGLLYDMLGGHDSKSKR